MCDGRRWGYARQSRSAQPHVLGGNRSRQERHACSGDKPPRTAAHSKQMSSGSGSQLAGSTLALPDRRTASPSHSDPELWLSDLRRLLKAAFSAVELVETRLSPAHLDSGPLLDLHEALAASDLA